MIGSHINRESFRSDLLSWYDIHKRDLPWRRTADPYAILVSELMLQQTQVKTVIPYFQRFLETFPTVEALAEAEETSLLNAWQGLGYYRRARHLQAAAKQIVEIHGGVFPREKAQIDALQGVGVYTAAAVSSIAFGLPWACVDGNVSRVLTRLVACDQDIMKTVVKNQIQQLAQDLIDPERAGDYNQAVMELGATTCTPKKPACGTCPVASHCATLAAGDDPEKRPYKEKRIKPIKQDIAVLVLVDGEKICFVKRSANGLMAGMWELPGVVRGELELQKNRAFYLQWKGAQPLGEPILHKFTHIHASYHVRAAKVLSEGIASLVPAGYETHQFLALEELDDYPTTKVTRRLHSRMNQYSREETCPASTYKSGDLFATKK